MAYPSIDLCIDECVCVCMCKYLCVRVLNKILNHSALDWMLHMLIFKKSWFEIFFCQIGCRNKI